MRLFARLVALTLGTLALATCADQVTGPSGEPEPSDARRGLAYSPAILVGAGDIASCNSKGDEATARLLDAIPGTVFTTGDNAYPSGTLSQYRNCYGKSWGRHKARTRPSPGNHEYETAGAAGYFDYFGWAAGTRGKGYYSYNRGDWHIVVLNSEIAMHAGSAQEQWLRRDLAAHPTRCTLAYWHRPRFSSGGSGNARDTKPLWDALYKYGAEVVLNGHDHLYERFAPQTPGGALDTSRGIRQFTIGTGGASLSRFHTVRPNSRVRYRSTPGVLKLSLGQNSYSWRFIPTSGGFTDTGTTACH